MSIYIKKRLYVTIYVSGAKIEAKCRVIGTDTADRQAVQDEHNMYLRSKDKVHQLNKI